MKTMQDLENKAENMDSEARIYEVGYLLTPSTEEADVPVEYGNLKELVASLDGTVIADEMPQKRDLAYTIFKVIKNIRHKFDSAYFGWVKFTMDADKLSELKKKLDLDSKIVRHLIMKTVRENTIASKRFTRSDMPRRRVPTTKTEGEAQPINKEEIDKEIDAMVAV